MIALKDCEHVLHTIQHHCATFTQAFLHSNTGRPWTSFTQAFLFLHSNTRPSPYLTRVYQALVEVITLKLK